MRSCVQVIMTGGLKTEAIDRINRRARLAGSIHKLLLDCMVTFPQYMHDRYVEGCPGGPCY